MKSNGVFNPHLLWDQTQRRVRTWLWVWGLITKKLPYLFIGQYGKYMNSYQPAWHMGASWTLMTWHYPWCICMTYCFWYQNIWLENLPCNIAASVTLVSDVHSWCVPCYIISYSGCYIFLSKADGHIASLYVLGCPKLLLCPWTW